MSKSWKANLAYALVIVTLCAAGVGYAAGGDASAAPGMAVPGNGAVAAFGRGSAARGLARWETNLKELVGTGVIDQATADQMTAFLQNDDMTNMVNAGILTQEQADAINAAGDPLAALVKDGTLTQEQADAVRAQKDPLAALVKDGTLTQEQADAVNAASPQGKMGQWGKPDGNGGKGRGPFDRH